MQRLSRRLGDKSPYHTCRTECRWAEDRSGRSRRRGKVVCVKSTTDVNGKPKATTVNVTGVLIDGIGYGASMIKKVGSVPVTVE